MKVSYSSHDNEGALATYEVTSFSPTGKSTPRTLSMGLLPIPGRPKSKAISPEEAAEMALCHHFDEGSFDIIEAPSKKTTVRASDQYVVAFEGFGWEIQLRPW